MPRSIGHRSVAQIMRNGMDAQRRLMRNSLRVICHRISYPTTVVGLTFHAGSRHEAPGCHGLAHLAEHVLGECCSGRGQLFRDECTEFGLIEDHMATDFDFTWFIAETAPESAHGLAALLSELSDPTARFLAERDIDIQRRVILSELDQLDNAGWVRGHRRLLSLLFGDRHPYGHAICGNRDDITALTGHEVEEWSERYFRPENAVLIVCGPHDPDLVFDGIDESVAGTCSPSTAPISSGGDMPNLPSAPRSETIPAERPSAALRRAWRVPAESPHLASAFLKVFLNSILTTIIGKNGAGIGGQIARSYKNHILCGLAEIQITDLSPDRVSLIQDVMDSVLAELADVDLCTNLLNKWQMMAGDSQPAGPERLSPFEWVQAHTFETFCTSPDGSPKPLPLPEFSAQDLATFVQGWIRNRHAEIVLTPTPSARKSPAARRPRRRPQPPPMRALMSWPEVISIQRISDPDLVVVQQPGNSRSTCVACFRAGLGADAGFWRGLSRFTLESALHRPLDAKGRTAPQIAATFDARIRLGRDLDMSLVQIDAPGPRTQEAIHLLKRICCALCETPDAETLQRTRSKLNSLVKRELRMPGARTLHTLPAYFFEDGHPYCCSWTGLEPREYPNELCGEMVGEFARRFFHPHAATFIIVSPLEGHQAAALTTISEHLPERVTYPQDRFNVPQYGGKPRAAPLSHLHTAGAGQTLISGAAILGPGIPGTDRFNTDILRHVLGAPKSGRFNNLIRTRLGDTYGVQTRVLMARGPQIFLMNLAVTPSVALRCIDLLRNELSAVRREPGLLATEIELEKRKNKRALVHQFSKVEHIVSVLLHCVSFGRDYDDVLTFRDGFDAVSVESIGAVLDRFFNPDDIVWMTAGADPADGEASRSQGRRMQISTRYGC